MEEKTPTITPKTEEFLRNEEMLSELIPAVYQLKENNHDIPLRRLIKKYGVQEKAFDFSGKITEMTVQAIIDDTMGRIERWLKYKDALARWKILKDAGALSPETLATNIQEYINKWMTASTEEAEKMTRYGEKLPVYNKEFLDEFIKDLQEQIKSELGWDVSIAHNKK